MTETAPFDPAAMRILIVGDNAHERRLLMDVLNQLGARDVLIAEDAVAAFAQLTLRKPNLIVADAEMKPISGFVLAREIRSMPIAQRATPLILVTAEPSPAFADAARGAGAQEVLSKPVSAQAMRKCLADAANTPPDQIAAFAPPKRRAADVAAQMREAAAPTNAMDRTARTAILANVDDARAKIARWAETGETALVQAAHAAIERASDEAFNAGADPALNRALAGALRLAQAAQTARADPHVLDVSLAAARALLSAPQGRNAMRQALAEAVSEVAQRGTGS